MANFTVRVVLHGATPLQYNTLHKAMISAGAFRRLRGSNNIIYDLPDGEYDMPSTLSAFALMQKVVGIATRVKALPKPSVLVTQVADRAWQLLPVPGQS